MSDPARPAVDIDAPRPTDYANLLDRLHRATLSLFAAIDARAEINVQYESTRTSVLHSLIHDNGQSVASAERFTANEVSDLHSQLIRANANVDRLTAIVAHWQFLIAHHHPPELSA